MVPLSSWTVVQMRFTCRTEVVSLWFRCMNFPTNFGRTKKKRKKTVEAHSWCNTVSCYLLNCEALTVVLGSKLKSPRHFVRTLRIRMMNIIIFFFDASGIPVDWFTGWSVLKFFCSWLLDGTLSVFGDDDDEREKKEIFFVFSFSLQAVLTKVKYLKCVGMMIPAELPGG